MSNIIQVSFVQSPQVNVHFQKKKNIYIQATDYYVKVISLWMTTYEPCFFTLVNFCLTIALLVFPFLSVAAQESKENEIKVWCHSKNNKKH